MSLQNRRRGLVAAAAALAAAAAGLLTVLPAQALAPGLDPANRLGDLTITPSSAVIVFNGGPSGLTTASGCPADYRRSSRVLLIWSDGTWSETGYPAATIVNANSATSGLTGQPISRTGLQAARWGAAAFPISNFVGHDGVATYVVTCDPGAAPDGSAPDLSAGVGSSKYFSADIMINYGDGSTPTWEVYTPPPLADSSESDISVDIPNETAVATGLKISVKPGPAVLTGPAARVQGQAWQASGSLDAVTVDDDRRDAAASPWTLNGRASTFTSTNTSDTVPATNLGWTPAKVSGAGAAGPAVAPGADFGLSVDKPLATGQASDSANVTTTVGAALALDVPSGVAGGSYTATLTLTLI